MLVNFNLEKDLLPVGSVVSIRFNSKKFMIMGYGPIDKENNKIYDYCAVIYPIGLLSLNDVTLISRDFIKKVHHIGYITDEYKSFMPHVEEALKSEDANKEG